MKTAFLVAQPSMASTLPPEQELQALLSLGVDVKPVSLGAPEAGAGSADVWQVAKAAASNPSGFFEVVSLVRRVGELDGAFGSGLKALSSACELLDEARRDGVDHVHSYGPQGAKVAMLCHALGGPSYSVAVDGTAADDAARDPALREALHRAAFTVCRSEEERRQILRDDAEAERDQLHVLPAGVDQATIDTPVTDVPDTRSFVCVGALGEDSRPELVLDALASLLRQGMAAQITFVGRENHLEELRHGAVRRGITHAVSFETSADSTRICALIDAARAVIHVGGGAFPLEAAAALARARPVIAARDDSGSEDDQLIDHRVGFVVPRDSSAKLAQAMASALRTPTAKLTRLGVVGRERVRTRHDGLSNAVKLYNLIFEHAGRVEREAEIAPPEREEELYWGAAAE